MDRKLAKRATVAFSIFLVFVAIVVGAYRFLSVEEEPNGEEEKEIKSITISPERFSLSSPPNRVIVNVTFSGYNLTSFDFNSFVLKDVFYPLNHSFHTTFFLLEYDGNSMRDILDIDLIHMTPSPILPYPVELVFEGLIEGELYSETIGIMLDE